MSDKPKNAGYDGLVTAGSGSAILGDAYEQSLQAAAAQRRRIDYGRSRVPQPAGSARIPLPVPQPTRAGAAARRVLSSPLVKAGGVAAEVVSAGMAGHDIYKNGANGTNVGDLASSAALAGIGSGALQLGARANPVVGAGAVGWQAGRLIGKNLPDSWNGAIGQGVNSLVQTASGGRLGVDDTALRAQEAAAKAKAQGAAFVRAAPK